MDRRFSTFFLMLLTPALASAVTPAASDRKESTSGKDRVLLILDAKKGYSDDLENFRVMTSRAVRKGAKAPSREGLARLRISGSSEFSRKGLEQLIEQIPSKRITIVDLRQESHGMVNGVPVSWEGDRNRANKHLAHDEVLADERSKLRALQRERRTTLERLDENWSRENMTEVPVEISTIQTEEQLVRSYGLDYVRFTVPDHDYPGATDADRFVDLVTSSPARQWFHFHCKAGVGRTTIFMIMADMMSNAGKVPLDDIVERQSSFINYDFRGIPPQGSFKRTITLGRDEFLRRFYDYCADNRPKFEVSYSEWLGTKH